MYRHAGSKLEVLLVHPGGPYWRGKDEGAWSIPKGEMEASEDAMSAASREFTEETGVRLAGPLEPLGEIRQRGGKRVVAFAVEGDLDAATIMSNSFEIEWPPRSGKMQAFPEIDRAEWFELPVADGKILEGQRPQRVHVLYFDAEVQRADTYECGQAIALEPVGGGGTEFGPCFEWLEEKGIQPQTLVFLTDLCGAFPTVAPAYSVLWASTESRRAPFGQVIPMEAA